MEGLMPVVAIIAQGAMGAGIGSFLSRKGVTVTTSLAGRSEASAKRAAAAGMNAVADDEIANADFILSIVPPGDSVTLAERLATGMRAAKRKPIYIDCNAISPGTAERIGTIVTATGSLFLDGGIIGGPPAPGDDGPSIFVSGPDAERTGPLKQNGLLIKVLDGPVGAASALKMSFGGITKCTTALGAAMVLAASRAGVTEALRAEMVERVPGLLSWLDRSFPQMFGKAYRFVDEMEEIAQYVDPRPEREIFDGAAKLYQHIADDYQGAKKDVDALAKFAAAGKKPA
jgi:3-hydroxyisobutyrate dehydrogenase-like beta-hydroxyacid dehydrogenase